MIPTLPEVLADLAAQVARNAAPNVHPAERAGTLGLSAALLGMAAESFDNAADLLVKENRALGELLRRAGRSVEPAADDFTVSGLSAANARLRADLIALQIEVEGRQDPEAQALEADIWALLVRSTEVRRRSGSPV